jgi:hypothetical protein
LPCAIRSLKAEFGDMLGTRKECLGMVPELLTDARETSYVICSTLLTAECSTIELPGIISILCSLRSIFKQRLGDMGDMICNNRGETDFDTSANGRAISVLTCLGTSV